MKGERFIIRGGSRLRGEVSVRGSKNAATKLMVASILTDEPCVIENVPLSADMEITSELCENLGSKLKTESGTHTLSIHTPVISKPQVTELSRKNRISILALGPMLHRAGIAEVPVLGGCPIGHRPVNFHIEALTRMGVTIERREHSYFAKAGNIHGAEISLPFPSVGATESILLTAVLAEGQTLIRNAAIEPEIFNLVEMLNAMGAHILHKEEAREFEINGVKELHGVTARTIPDRNEAVSFAVSALATGGEILVHGAVSGHLKSFLEKVKEIGGRYSEGDGGILFRGADSYKCASVETSPHPGFMTDWQQPFCVLLTKATSTSIIHETVYEDRFGYTRDLVRMGANIEVSSDCLGFPTCRFAGGERRHSARINGPSDLHGEEIVVPDIRAGMAHIIAALIAEGESSVSGIEHIDRGYEKLDERLRELGAEIRRIKS